MSHTWEIILDYHRCPKCGKILESREGYTTVFGTYQKDLQCSRCNHLFIVKKPTKPLIGPFFGEGEGAEFDWGGK